jgi:hypothetical protein
LSRADRPPLLPTGRVDYVSASSRSPAESAGESVGRPTSAASLGAGADKIRRPYFASSVRAQPWSLPSRGAERGRPGTGAARCSPFTPRHRRLRGSSSLRSHLVSGSSPRPSADNAFTTRDPCDCRIRRPLPSCRRPLSRISTRIIICFLRCCGYALEAALLLRYLTCASLLRSPSACANLRDAGAKSPHRIASSCEGIAQLPVETAHSSTDCSGDFSVLLSYYSTSPPLFRVQ